MIKKEAQVPKTLAPLFFYYCGELRKRNDVVTGRGDFGDGAEGVVALDEFGGGVKLGGEGKEGGVFGVQVDSEMWQAGGVGHAEGDDDLQTDP